MTEMNRGSRSRRRLPHDSFVPQHHRLHHDDAVYHHQAFNAETYRREREPLHNNLLDSQWQPQSGHGPQRNACHQDDRRGEDYHGHSNRKRQQSSDKNRGHREPSDRWKEPDDGRSRQYNEDRHERRRHRRRRRRKRQRSESDSAQLPPPGSPPADGIRRRSGVVSVDYNDGNQNEKPSTPKRLRHSRRSYASPSEESSHDDTADHYKGDPGAMLGNQFQVIKEVGMGTFGRVLECLDLRRRDCVAVKVVRAVNRYYESALIEARIVQDINRRGGRGLSHCVRLFDSFTFKGHYCIVFESLGPSLYDFLKQHGYRPFPLVVVQDITVQLLETLEFLHSLRIIHTDLKLENILLMNDCETMYNNQRVPDSTRVKLIDFGSACHAGDKRSSVINTRQYRAPEVILGTGWSMPSDIWSAGCILAEIYKGELLFATHDSCEHLALMDHIIGPFPQSLVQRALATSKESIVSKVFDNDGRMKRIESLLGSNSVSYVRKAETLSSIIRNPTDAWFLALLRFLLAIDPQERSTAHEALQYLSRMRRDVVRCA